MSTPLTGWLCPSHGAVRPDIEMCPKCAPKEETTTANKDAVDVLKQWLDENARPLPVVPYMVPYIYPLAEPFPDTGRITWTSNGTAPAFTATGTTGSFAVKL